jgi:hypothetical protein
MGNKHVIDKRSIKLDEILKSDYIPFLGGRPERDEVISHDDVLNLSIALNTAETLEELLENV